jgi:hypothetical protein
MRDVLADSGRGAPGSGRTVAGRRLRAGLLALLGALLIAGAAPLRADARVSPSLAPTLDVGVPLAVAAAQPSSIIVVRREGGGDGPWGGAPTDGSATKLVDLAFRPSRVEASPDGTRIALLPAAIGPRVYVCDVANATVKVLSLTPRGVRSVDSFTWISPTRLLVAGSASATRVAYRLSDRLYSLNVVTGASASFRDLRGTEPSAAPAAARLVYVRLADAGPAANEPGSRLVSERLISLKLAPGTTPRVIARARYVDSLDIRRFRDPRVSPGGRFVITSTTGSDVSVSYMVRWVSSGKALFTKATTLAGRDATAWRPQGGRVAFWGMPPAGPLTTTRLYVYDIATRRLTSTAPFSNAAMTGLSWSPDGAQIAFALRAFSSGADVAALWTVDPAVAASAAKLGTGSLPVWPP